MRYFYRPSATIAWRELVMTCVALVAAVWLLPELWRSLNAFLGPWIASAGCWLPLLGLRQPSLRNPLIAGLGGLTSLRARTRAESGIVEDSEAEREVRGDDDDGESYLTAHANYLVRVRRTDGVRRTLQLPREIWAPLRVGEPVTWTRRGIWLLEVRKGE